ncbi:MAG: hypothetical protein HY907_19890 [Deltaproteobacteria bacterium]|nr:hypothetical protein [Deltaproteobacteria bacterium]
MTHTKTAWIVCFVAASLAALAGGCPGRSGSPATPAVEDDLPDPGWTLSVVLRRQTADGAAHDVPLVERAVSDLALVPLSLDLRGMPLREESAAPAAPAFGFGSMAGALGAGGTAGGAGTVDTVRLDGSFRIGPETVAVPAWTARCDRDDACLTLERLEFTLAAPGAASRVTALDLFAAATDGELPPLFRRASILVAPGRVGEADVHAALAAVPADVASENGRRELEGLARDPAAAGGEEAALARVAALDDAVGAPAGQLLALAFAAESDLLTDRLAAASGVVVGRAVPRLLVATVDGGSADRPASATLDLRLDEVEARPQPGRPEGAARVFQVARGILESSLEGAVLRRALGGVPATTAAVLATAERLGIGTRRLRPADRAALPAGLPPLVAARVAETLDRGHEAALPERAVPFAGRERWAWWDIDPVSGRFIGVAEDGQHQGMIEVVVTTEEASLNEDYAFAIGMHTGAVGVEFGIAAGMLTWGGVTEEMIDEVEDLVATVACASCAKLELKTELKLELGDDCWEWNPLEETPLEVGAEISLGFCEAYAEGFQCSTGILIAALRGEPLVELEASGPVALTIGCDVDSGEEDE